jgi:parvulin-like peptidyl-prolyl isomerase
LEELSNQLQKVVKNMKTGDFTDVLNTDFGYQIIYVQDIVETPAKPIEAVESEIHEVLYNEFVDDKYDEWLGELRERSHIKVIN